MFNILMAELYLGAILTLFIDKSLLDEYAYEKTFGGKL